MRYDFFQCFHLVTASGKNSQAGRPHHDSLRDQIDTGKYKTFHSIDSLSDRITEKSRIGTDRTVLETFITSLCFSPEHQFSINHTKHLNTDGDKKNLQIVCKIAVRGTLRKCMEDVAGKYQIDYKIIDIFLPLRTNDMYFFHKKSYSYQNKDRELQCQQSYHKFTI